MENNTTEIDTGAVVPNKDTAKAQKSAAEIEREHQTAVNKELFENLRVSQEDAKARKETES